MSGILMDRTAWYSLNQSSHSSRESTLTNKHDSMAATTHLEHLYHITENSYTTGSEWLDGLLIGLATLILIRNGEFVLLDLLTFFLGNKKYRVGFRVLRVWQMLNIKHFYHLVTGFDSDMPYSPFRSSHIEKRAGIAKLSQRNIKKGKFATLLFVSVLLGKLFILGLEVAIIAFVIPIAKVHKSDGGVGVQWKNTTVTEASLSSLPTCQPLLASNVLTDNAQLALCKRLDVRDSDLIPQSWIQDGSLRMEEIYLTPSSAEQSGGSVAEDGEVLCPSPEGDEVSFARDLYPQEASRQVSYNFSPSAEYTNSVRGGEILISGHSVKSTDERFFFGTAAILPIFSDAQRTLRLSFVDFYDGGVGTIGARVPTVNGKLLFGAGRGIPGEHTRAICPHAIEEIMRVTGTLHPGLIIDLLRLSMTVTIRSNFTKPSPDLNSLSIERAFEIGTSRRFRIQPEWMIVAAALMVVLSSITSRLNRTEVRIARVYRERNNMWSASSPAFLEGENVVEGALFRNENGYHWGESPGEEWEELSRLEFSSDAVLV